MEFTGAFAGGHNVLLTRYPTEQFSTEAVSKPFSTQVLFHSNSGGQINQSVDQVWIGWIVAFVVVSISSTLFVYARFQLNNVNKTRRLKTIDGMLFYIIGTITAQGAIQCRCMKRNKMLNLMLVGGYYRAGHHFLGILAISWCLAAFVFVNVYSTVLTSSLATSYVAPEINSMEDLAESSHFKMALIQGSTAEEDVLVEYCDRVNHAEMIIFIVPGGYIRTHEDHQRKAAPVPTMFDSFCGGNGPQGNE
jgi:hypothetical protein